MTYLIAEAARRSGLPTTTIRFYEDSGLLARPRRSPNGYRSYDDRDVERLRVAAQARRLGLSASALRHVVEAWEAGGCGQVAGALSDQVREVLADVHRRIGELTTAASSLRTTSAALAAVGEHDGPCGDACACVVDASAVARHQEERELVIPADVGAALAEAVSCALPDETVPDRLEQWQALAARASSTHATASGYRVSFAPDPTLAAEIAALATAEHACCPVFRFQLEITADAYDLQVTAPAEALPLLAAMLDTAGA